MIKPIAVDLQYDFTQPEGKHFRPSRTCLQLIRREVIQILLRADMKIGEIISDYRQPRPGDHDDSCRPGTWGYRSEIPEALVQTKWIKCLNSPLFTRENIGIAEAEPGLPFANPDGFYDWLDSYASPDDTIVLFGLTLDCCVLCTAQAIKFRGYNVRVLLDATDTYEGTENLRYLTMNLVVKNWATPMRIKEFRLNLLGEERCG